MNAAKTKNAKTQRGTPKASGNGKTPGVTLPPHDAEAELAVLGALLLDAEIAIPQVTPILKASDFYIVKHGWVYAACMALAERGESVDFVTVTRELEQRGQLAEFDDGERFVRTLGDNAPTAYHAKSYAYPVRKDARRRELLNLASGVASDVYGDDCDPDAITETLYLTSGALMRDNLTAQANTSWADMDRILQPVTWAWPGWLPNGFLTVVASEPGEGKSALLLRIAASFMRGDCLPDGTPFTGAKGDVLWCEAEAAQALNLDRARNWGLPLDRLRGPLGDPLEEVHLADPKHRMAITASAKQPDIRLVIVDSLSGSTENKDDKTAKDMMPIVKWLAEMARDTGKPLMVSHHLRKRGMFDSIDGVDLDRVRGSSAIVQPARSVWAIDTPDRSRKETKRLSVIKLNLGAFPQPVGMTVTGNGILFGEVPETPKDETVKDKAADLLLSLLSGGPVRYTEIEGEFNGAGISMRSADRAKQALHVVSVRHADGWYWSLPAHE